MLDGGRVVDVGTADELEERCPLFRLLLSGPGDDAEVSTPSWKPALGADEIR